VIKVQKSKHKTQHDLMESVKALINQYKN